MPTSTSPSATQTPSAVQERKEIECKRLLKWQRQACQEGDEQTASHDHLDRQKDQVDNPDNNSMAPGQQPKARKWKQNCQDYGGQRHRQTRGKGHQPTEQSHKQIQVPVSYKQMKTSTPRTPAQITVPPCAAQEPRQMPGILKKQCSAGRKPNGKGQ